MLSKFKNLQGIGVYHNYSASGEGLDLKQCTAIIANNGYGKSTLVAVLRSMVENCPEIIEARQTLGKEIDQFAIINVSGGVIKFENGSWSIHKEGGICPDIIIYDDQYIQDNLFVKEVEAGHRKKIYQLIIGVEGRKLADELNLLIQEEKEKRKLFQDIKRDLDKRNRAASVANYLDISKEIAIEAKSELEKLDKQLTTIKNAEEIATLLKFESIEPLIYDLEKMRELLTKSLETVHKEAKRKVEDHIRNHLNPSKHTEEFLRLGNQLQKEVCPYCGQSLEKSLDLMDAYQSFFNETYTSFQQALNNEIERVESWDLSGEVSRIQHWMNGCENNINQLHYKTGENEQRSLSNLQEKYFERAKTVKNNLLNQLKEKQKNTSLIISDDSINEFNNFLSDLVSEIEVFKNELARISEIYTKAIDYQETQSVDELENSKKIFQKRIERFSDDEIDWCNEYEKIEREAEESKLKRDEAAQQLSAYSKSLFKSFEDGVNDYLKLLRAQFSISGVEQKTDSTSTEAYVNFSIEIRNECVPLKSLSRSPKPEFTNTLSNGDRNTLSLAIFLSWLDMQPDLHDKVIIFDDPLTSMDDNRRLGTAKVLAGLSSKVKQMIVFTHKEDFLFQLDDEISSLHGLTLKCDQTNGSEILPFDIKYARKDIHFRRIDEMNRYLEEDFGPTAKEMQENIRLVLERILRLKYYPYLENINTLGSMIDSLEENTFLDEDILKELRDLNRISSSVHHAEEVGRPIQDLKRDDLLPEIMHTLEIIKKIQDKYLGYCVQFYE